MVWHYVAPGFDSPGSDSTAWISQLPFVTSEIGLTDVSTLLENTIKPWLHPLQLIAKTAKRQQLFASKHNLFLQWDVSTLQKSYCVTVQFQTLSRYLSKTLPSMLLRASIQAVLQRDTKVLQTFIQAWIYSHFGQTCTVTDNCLIFFWRVQMVIYSGLRHKLSHYCSVEVP